MTDLITFTGIDGSSYYVNLHSVGESSVSVYNPTLEDYEVFGTSDRTSSDYGIIASQQGTSNIFAIDISGLVLTDGKYIVTVYDSSDIFFNQFDIYISGNQEVGMPTVGLVDNLSEQLESILLYLKRN